MATPPRNLEDIPVPKLDLGYTPEQLDTEVDAVTGTLRRIAWTAGVEIGYENPLWLVDVLASGVYANPREVAARVVPTGGNRFPNECEWGVMDLGYGPFMGLYFTAAPAGLSGPKEIWGVDPNPPLPPYTPVLILALTMPYPYDCWLSDAWRRLGAPLIVFQRSTPNNPDPVERGQMWVYDPKQAWIPAGDQRQVPNFVPYLDNVRNRAYRIVEEHPSMVFPLYTWPGEPDPDITPDTWQLIWQLLDEQNGTFTAAGATYFAFTPSFPAATNTVLGVGVLKLPKNNQLGFGWTHAGFFVYALRRHDHGGQVYSDHVDYYVFDYDDGNRLNSRVILQHSFDVPVVTGGPSPGSYSGIGDDEPYVDPEGNPCIALSMVELPTLDPNMDPGAICVFTFDYLGYRGPSATSARIAMISDPNAASAPRKDPEPLTTAPEPTAGPAVYIFNRERLPPPDEWWTLHRTLAWDRNR